MNGRAAKLIRRDLRRTVGEDGIEALTATTNALNNSVFPNLNAVQARAESIDERVKALEKPVYDVKRDDFATVQSLCTDRNDLWDAVSDVAERTKALESFHDTICEHIGRVSAELSIHKSMSLWQRLRWLVLGR